MGNHHSNSREWVKDSLQIIKLKFNNVEIHDKNNVPISWANIEHCLEILYDYKYRDKNIIPTDLQINPVELECYI